MIVAGVMSGTSADGIDVALVEVTGRQPHEPKGKKSPARQKFPPSMRLKLLGNIALPYRADVRKAILAAMNSPSASVADLARLNFLLGDLYADAVLGAQKKARVKAELVGCHGQTLYHQGSPALFLGRKLAVTWQTGEASRIATRVGVPVISDFRPADMAAEGKGAPLVPFLDYFLYRDHRMGRIALNLGGIANVTAIPAHADLDDVVAFDTGPGNMIMDALTAKWFRHGYDRNGSIAASGQVREDIIAYFLARRFFRERPPKTAGREEFGREFAREFQRVCFEASPKIVDQPTTAKSKSAARATSKADLIATATAFTARSVSDALRRHVLPYGKFSEVVASGGGTRNRTLMAMLANNLKPLGLTLRTSDEFGIPSQAKEAVAFAVLAYETWHQRPSNVPSATGAKRAAVLGKISYP